MKSFQKDKQEEDKLEPVKVQIAYYSLSKNKNKYISWEGRDLRGHVKGRNKVQFRQSQKKLICHLIWVQALF